MSYSDRSRILILAQTNPTFSKKYVETVCTAGIMDLGGNNYKWVRLYPIVKRILPVEYHKFQWISCALNECDRNNDKRPESWKVYEHTIEAHERLNKGSAANWELRRHILLHSNIQVIKKKQDILNAAKENAFSLCLFKPAKVGKFTAHEQSIEFTEEEQAHIDNAQKQGVLIDFGTDFRNLKFIKIPYYFKCIFEDEDGFSSNMTVLDWEMSSLYRKEARRLGTPTKAMESVLKKYNQYIDNNDLYFVLGTRHVDHKKLISHPNTHINPWSIISVIAFPKSEGGAQTLLDGIL